jgi:hypothetical protein
MADTAKTKPKKKPFLTVGVPGGRGGSLGPGVAQPNLLTPMKARNKPVSKTMTTPTEGTTPTGSAPVGRPPSNLGKYLVKPTPTSITGYEMLNETPDVLDKVHEQFIKKFELPTHLRPTRYLSPELEHGRGLAISKGFRAPRSRSK